ncbi:MAG: AI-2E family transporter [Ferruginibacter sp.]
MALLKPRMYLPFYAKLALVLVSLISMGYIFVLAKQILSPLLYSFLFAILLLPLATWLEKKFRFPRSLAASSSVLLMILFIYLIVYFVGSQLSSLADDWPVFKQTFAASLSDFQHWISQRFHVNMAKQINYINKATSNLVSSSTTIIGETVLSLSSLILFLVFVTIYTFFILFYRRLIIRFLIAVFQEENAVTVLDIVEQVQFIIRKYIVGLLLEMAIVSAACCIAFSIIGIKYAILLGFITGLFNIIPYIGIFSSLVLTTLITIGTAASTTTIVLVMCTIGGMHLVDSNFLLPFIVGSKVKINAFITLLGVIIGEMLWGISGMFLSVPVIAICKIVFDRIDSLNPWGLLLGDEKDEEEPGKLREEVHKGGIMDHEEPSLEQKTLGKK